jgi:hypothetical protein
MRPSASVNPFPEPPVAATSVFHAPAARVATRCSTSAIRREPAYSRLCSTRYAIHGVPSAASAMRAPNPALPFLSTISDASVSPAFVR